MNNQFDAFAIVLILIIIFILLFLFPEGGGKSQRKMPAKNMENDEQDHNEKKISDELEKENCLIEIKSSVRETQLSEESVVIEADLDSCQEFVLNEPPLSNLEQSRAVGNHKLRIRSFQIQKMGLSEAECEDRSALSSHYSSSFRIAVADGATESLFSDVWANILVKSYIEKGADFLHSSSLDFIHQEFVQRTSQRILEMPETRQWLMYEKLERGSHATLAAVEFTPPETIQILTIGDSCVFWRNKEERVEMLPQLSPQEFGAFPASICHLPQTWQNLEQKLVKTQILLQKNFQMLLCTDALACWLATELQNEFLAWERLFQISDAMFFTSFIANLRKQNNIRNDDVTLVLIDALPINV